VSEAARQARSRLTGEALVKADEVKRLASYVDAALKGPGPDAAEGDARALAAAAADLLALTVAIRAVDRIAEAGDR
jgi:hypothetical protein